MGKERELGGIMGVQRQEISEDNRARESAVQDKTQKRAAANTAKHHQAQEGEIYKTRQEAGKGIGLFSEKEVVCDKMLVILGEGHRDIAP